MAGAATIFKYSQQTMDDLGVVYKDASPQYASVTFKVRGADYHPATYLEAADYGISLTPLKIQNTDRAGGITGVIKNMMGACSNSTTTYSGGTLFHDGPPAFQGFVDLFKNYADAKVVLYMADMLLASSNLGAPQWSSAFNRITMGVDPCAVDSYFADVLGSLGYIEAKYGDGKGVPRALEKAGLGTTSYCLIQPAGFIGPKPHDGGCVNLDGGTTIDSNTAIDSTTIDSAPPPVDAAASDTVASGDSEATGDEGCGCSVGTRGAAGSVPLWAALAVGLFQRLRDTSGE
jgi:hypothetical protein